MSVEDITISDELAKEGQFQPDQVLPIAGAHFVHDIYTAFFAPLLPQLIDKLSLSFTQVGWLKAIMGLPAVLNPFIGYMADRVSVRYFVILAPAVSATLMSVIGLAPNYFTLALLLFTTGISVSAFHAPAPAMIGRVSGNQMGKGMSWYMAAGELARAIGPIIAAGAVSLWGLEGIYRTMFVGWAMSGILFLRLRHISARSVQPSGLRALLPLLPRLFIPFVFIHLFRGFLAESLTTFLPTYMHQQGADVWLASGALSILEFAAVGGALLSGPLSDRLGRKPLLLAITAGAAIFTLVFIKVQGWMLLPVLIILGFISLSAMPIMLALVQEHMSSNRAVGNGLFMFVAFMMRAIAALGVGILSDRFGLQQAFFWSAIISLGAIPAIIALPGPPQTINEV